MAMAMQSDENSRYTDLNDEPVNRLLSPINGYEDKPLVPLIETVKPISGFFNEIKDYVYVALHDCQNPADGLDQQESASIHLYTMPFHDGPSLHVLLNQSLRAENHEELKPWFSFLKLFLTALHKLPSESGTVWRGVRDVDLTSKYRIGTKFAWWGVSSCTTDNKILESNAFLGKHGLRTLFSIECINGKSIKNHSYFKNTEKEILLMPGSYFEVIGQLNPTSQLHIIQLREISPPITFVQPSFSKSIDNNRSSVVHKSHRVSKLISKTISKITSSKTSSKQMPTKSYNKWKQIGVTIAGGNGDGFKLKQLLYPQGLFIDDDQTIYIADSGNDRIVEWKSDAKNGQIIAGGNGRGSEINQLYHPTDVIIDRENDCFIICDQKNRRVIQWSRQNNTNGQVLISDIDCHSLTMDNEGSLYVSDCQKNEVRRWKRGETNGTIVAGGNGEGNNFNQLDHPTFIFIDQDYSLYVSDSNNHRVMKWLKDAQKGIVIAGGNRFGNSLAQLNFPQGLIVDRFDQIYVVDTSNHRVIRWCKEDKEGTIIVGGNGQGQYSNQLHAPTSLSFDQQDNLYVVDCFNHRIQKFKID